jgi:hypothetical protein
MRKSGTHETGRRFCPMFTPAAPAPSDAMTAARQKTTAGEPGVHGEIAVLLYAVSALLLLWRLGANPGYPFNWEEYTAWNIFRFWEPGPYWREILAPGNGVMTDSGRGLLIGLPGSASFALFGVGLTQLRVPIALLAALAPPLLWLAGRQVLPARVALLGAALLAVCPVFDLYGRTATLVGISLVPLLLAFWALASVLTAPRGAGGLAAVGLAVSLCLGIFAYAPVRLMWPISLAVLVLAALFDRSRRWQLVGAALLGVLIVPAMLILLDRATAAEPDPMAAVSGYFRARDETILHMTDKDRLLYLRQDAPSFGSPVVRLVLQNLRDLVRVVFDRGTMPLRSDYWNASGSIWPAWFGVLAVAGAVLAVLAAIRRREWGGLLALACAGGFAAPLLLTSRVDSGRLLAAVPFACLLVALAVDAGTGAIVRFIRRHDPGSWLPRALPAAAPVAVVLALWGASAVAMREPAMLSRQVREAQQLAGLAGDAPTGGIVLVVKDDLGREIERVHASSHRLLLEQYYQMVDLNGPDALVRGPERPTLRYGEALTALEEGSLEDACESRYAIQPEVRDRVEAALERLDCDGMPEVIDLPQ